VKGQMFCNYCRQVNPNDAVYCCACGREIDIAFGGQKQSDPVSEKRGTAEVVPAPSAHTASNTMPNGPAPLDSFSIEELKDR
jgi:hypothetical protein